MQALLFDPAAPSNLRFDEAPEPEPGPSEALIQVAATTLNFGEIAYLDKRVEVGGVPGWDASGTVVTAAGDGSGPSAGARVTSFGPAGAWAELRAADTGELAVLPDGLEFGAAAALPVAGVTALRSLRRLGAVVGRRVLITGASGGVGRFAVQLAARAGAHVVAVVGSSARAEGLERLGAAEVIVGLDDLARPVDAALDHVGGSMLADAHALLGPGCAVVSVGNASLEPTTIDFEEARQRADGTRVEVFTVGGGFGADLPYLLSLLAAGDLDPQIGWRGPWERASEAAEALIGRRIAGKAVLEVAS
jgi:NADPH:quinone reductase